MYIGPVAVHIIHDKIWQILHNIRGQWVLDTEVFSWYTGILKAYLSIVGTVCQWWPAYV